MSGNKQYFYLVAIQRGESDTNVVPNKITLQEYEAVKYGRRLATQLEHDVQDGVIGGKVRLYRQSITKTGTIEFIRILHPYYQDCDKLVVFAFTFQGDYHERYGLGKTVVEALNSIEFRDPIDKSNYKVRALEPDGYIITPNNGFIVIETKAVSGVESLYEFNGKWRTGLYFAGHHCECWHLDYDDKDQAEQDYHYLLSRFGK